MENITSMVNTNSTMGVLPPKIFFSFANWDNCATITFSFLIALPMLLKKRTYQSTFRWFNSVVMILFGLLSFIDFAQSGGMLAAASGSTIVLLMTLLLIEVSVVIEKALVMLTIYRAGPTFVACCPFRGISILLVILLQIVVFWDEINTGKTWHNVFDAVSVYTFAQIFVLLACSYGSYQLLKISNQKWFKDRTYDAIEMLTAKNELNKCRSALTHAWRALLGKAVIMFFFAFTSVFYKDVYTETVFVLKALAFWITVYAMLKNPGACQELLVFYNFEENDLPTDRPVESDFQIKQFRRQLEEGPEFARSRNGSQRSNRSNFDSLSPPTSGRSVMQQVAIEMTVISEQGTSNAGYEETEC